MHGVDPDLNGSATLWEPGTASGSASYKNQDLEPHQNNKLEPDLDPHQFADDKPTCMVYEPI
jgi:hypothetical protein